MQFIDAIKEYQESGGRSVFDMIRAAMDYDYLRSPSGMAFDRPEMYVAFRCLRLISGRLATIKYTLAENGLHSRRDSPEYIFAEYARSWYSYTGEEITVENFEEYEEEMRRYLGDTFSGMKTAYLRLVGEKPSIWSLLQGHVVDEHWPELQDALEYAIKRVDTSRSEREIIRYINRATKTAYYRKQFEGMRRVRRGGATRYVTPTYYGPIYAIFGRINGGCTLSSRQQALIDRISAVIEEDYAGGRMENYAVDLRGGYRIVNRYIAGRIGMHEASVSRALSRMKRC